MVAGGLGSLFEDPAISAFWHEVNHRITRTLHERLHADRYNVVPLIVPVSAMRDSEPVVTQGLWHSRCNRLIQVSHRVDEDAQGAFFQFRIEQFRLRPAATSSPADPLSHLVTVGEYERRYRFPRTLASFESFHTDVFAGTAYDDLVRSGVLHPLR